MIFEFGSESNRKRNVLAVRKALQDRRRIITDRHDAQPLFFQLVQIPFELHELRLAEGSPVSGSKENQHRAFGAHDGLKALSATQLIRRRKTRDILADLRPGLDRLRLERDSRNQPPACFGY